MRFPALAAAALLLFATPLPAQQAKPDAGRGMRMLDAYFQAETARLRDACLDDVKSLDDWKRRRAEYHRELMYMLGLDPLPERSDLKAKTTGTVEHDEFVVERLHFQSSPGLYVTGNLYLPKNAQGPLPAVLYVCGHGSSKRGGVSFGNKANYHHHGSWFARNGYVCLTIDTLQLGEIEGLHHGTYRYGMWWWLNRGYTPAGVEAWNCIRSLDYLQTRKEVDPERIGVTGRSGGGAYSWWIAAIDERIKAAVPVAGITDLENHVVDGVVEGHCDCMYFVNTYQWDYPLLAAMVAPRPLLISNTDRDRIFPLDGVYRTHQKARKIYDLYGAHDELALHITAGGHKDTQELRVHAFRWLNHWLKKDDSLIETAARPLFDHAELRVFADLPAGQKNTTIQESFVPLAVTPPPPQAQSEWEAQRNRWLAVLKDKSFRAWPAEPGELELKEVFSVERDGIRFSAYDFTSQEPFRLRLYLAHRAGLDKADLVVLNALDGQAWQEFLATMRPSFETELADCVLPEPDQEAYRRTQGMFKSFKWAMAYVAPRGVGPTDFGASERKHVQLLRRFYLMGQTLDGMQTWDIRRAIQSLRGLDEMKEVPLWLQGHRAMAGNALYASLYEPGVARLDLHQLPATHREGPIYLNIERHLTMPQAVAMAAERARTVLYQDDEQGWDYPRQVVKTLALDEKQLQVRAVGKQGEKAEEQ